MENFDKEFVVPGNIELSTDFATQVYAINNNAPTVEFATEFIETAEKFLQKVRTYRAGQLA